MTKYVIKVGSKYLTSYGNLTDNVCCADKYKYREDAEEVAEYDKLECEKEKERHGNNPPSEFSKFIPFEKLKIIKVELMEGNNEQCGYKNRLAKIYEIF